MSTFGRVMRAFDLLMAIGLTVAYGYFAFVANADFSCWVLLSAVISWIMYALNVHKLGKLFMARKWVHKRPPRGQ